MNIIEFNKILKSIQIRYNLDPSEDINIIVKTIDGDSIVTGISSLDIWNNSLGGCGLDIITEEVDLDG